MDRKRMLQLNIMQQNISSHNILLSIKSQLDELYWLFSYYCIIDFSKGDDV